MGIDDDGRSFAEPALGAALPAVLLTPRKEPKKETPRILVWIADEGTAALFDASGSPTPAVARALQAGVRVLGVDLFEQGEFLADGTPFAHVRLASPRAHAGYTFGYNHPLPAERVQDVLTAVRAARARVGPDGVVLLIGRGPASGLAAGARMLARSEIDRAVFDVAGFRFASATRIDDPTFLPGAVKYGDVARARGACGAADDLGHRYRGPVSHRRRVGRASRHALGRLTGSCRTGRLAVATEVTNIDD